MKKLLILIAILGISGFVFVWLWFPTSSLCFSKDKHVLSSVHGTLFSPSEDKIAFAMYYKLYRPPVGICTFPDGGGNLVVDEKIKIYTSSVSGGEVKLLASISAPKGYQLRYDGYQLKGWKGGNLYLWAYFASAKKSYRSYYKINGQTGEISELPANAQAEFEKSYYGQNTFLPSNSNQHLKYEEKVGIILVEGKGIVLDKENQTIVQQGVVGKTIKTIIDQKILENLLPAAKSVQFLQSTGML